MLGFKHNIAILLPQPAWCTSNFQDTAVVQELEVAQQALADTHQRLAEQEGAAATAAAAGDGVQPDRRAGQCPGGARGS